LFFMPPSFLKDATTQYNTIFEVQCLTYLRLSGLKLGLVSISVNAGSRTAFIA